MKRKAKQFTGVPVRGGKQYVEVKDRLKYLAEDFEGEYSIATEYEYFAERKMWVVKATLTLTQGEATNTYTGLAQEIESEKFGTVNNTSALENAETSAVGRACAMAGIGIDLGVASADEIHKAQARGDQNQLQPAAPVQHATQKQKADIVQLLKDDVITQEEREKGMQGLNNLDKSQADRFLAKLQKNISDRAAQAVIS